MFARMVSGWRARQMVLLFLISWMVPHSVAASIYISEVAWMGSADSANYEWIELHNPGPAVDVTGWRLYDESRIDIELAGIIPAGEYVILERTSDASAPGAAFLVYTGALANTGAVLTLKQSDDTVADQVRSGEDWELIGGDNETKETAQRTSVGWITAAPTPGSMTVAQNSSQPESKDITTDTSTARSSTGQSVSRSDAEPIVLTLPDITLQLAVSGPTVVQVNQPATFAVTPSGVGRTIADSLRYEWNFGDGTTETGASVTHQFAHPGRYVVVAHGQYKRQTQVTRLTIDVVEPQVSIVTEGEYVLITNTSDREVLLGEYTLRGRQSLSIPERTILLPGQVLRVPVAEIGQPDHTLVALYDQADQPVALQLPPAARLALAQSDESDEVMPVTTARTVTAYQPPVYRAPVVLDPPTIAPDPLREQVVPDEQLLAAYDHTTTPALLPETVDNWPLYSLVGLLLLAIVALYVVPPRQSSESPYAVVDEPPFIK